MFPILLSALTSGVSMAVFFTAISWFIEDRFNSTILVSIVLSSGYVLAFFVLPKIGSFIDVNSSKKALNAAYILGLFNSIVFLLLMSTISNEIVSVIIILILTSIFTLIRSSDQIIRSTYVKRMCSEKDIYRANKNLELIRQGITFLSGGVAFFILQDESINNVCIINIACFSISLLINFYVKKDNHYKKTQNINDKNDIKNAYRIGFEFFNGKKKRYVTLLSIFPYICVVSLNSIYPALFTAINSQIKYYALLVVPYGIGAIIGSLISFNNALISLKDNYIIFGSFFIVGLLLPIFFNHYYAVYLCLFIIALSHSRIRVIRNTFIMNESDSKNLGKTLSFNEIIFIVSSVFLTMLLGLLSDFIGFWWAWYTVIILNISVLSIIIFSKDI
ncbi:hypothetical protein PSI19_04935 [Xenorhabdus khoisanae]|uniref:hypothetical protein n=1 Tax=Xenorhabdus khoisanae TaxID=880157 RepID=UPI0023597A2E|nr:hypothetical protein [Xenorhabdus khoisanae]MDC9613241.1 hypothetical protein [Xenorhabdus khoisanae]